MNGDRDFPGPHSAVYPDEAQVRGGDYAEPENRDGLLAERTARLSRLIVEFAANVQPDQVVAITLEAGMEPLMLAVAEAAYARGARFVDPWTFYPAVKRSRLLHAPAGSLEYVAPWIGERLLKLAELHGALIRLSGPSGGRLLDDIEPSLLGRDMMPRLRESQEMVAAGTVNWTVVPSPSPGWASIVYPSMEPGRGVERLWDDIAWICRLDQPDPEAAWRRRFAELGRVARTLDEARFDALRFEGPGTSLTVGLLPSSIWLTGAAQRDDGLQYLPNLPTEEIFTAPDPERVEGVVRCTKPLVVGGGTVEGMVVRFEAGRAVSVEAERGADLVSTMTARDDGAARLGEVALVDGESRIGQTGKVFYDTLLDENAASHIAFGRGYEDTVETTADRERLNDSGIHIDFMIGSNEVDVTALTRDGSLVPLLRGGAWQI